MRCLPRGAYGVGFPGKRFPAVPELDQAFESLMGQLRLGSQDAGWELVATYGPHIQTVVRRGLDKRLRSKFDSLDFVQAVWASFFRSPGRLDGIETPEQLIGLLAAFARNKMVDEFRRRYTLKYDVTREVPIEVAVADPESVFTHDPTPSQVAIAREMWERSLESLSPLHQKIVNLRFEGATFDEIAVELQVSKRTAQRVIDRLIEGQNDDAEASIG